MCEKGDIWWEYLKHNPSRNKSHLLTMLRNAEEEDEDDLVIVTDSRVQHVGRPKKGSWLSSMRKERKKPGAHLVNLNRMMLSHNHLIAVQCNAMNRCNLSIATKMKRRAAAAIIYLDVNTNSVKKSIP